MFFYFILKAFEQELQKSESFQFDNLCPERDVEVGVATNTKGLIAPNVTCAAQVSSQDMAKEQENNLVMGITASECSSNIRYNKCYDYANDNIIYVTKIIMLVEMCQIRPCTEIDASLSDT